MPIPNPDAIVASAAVPTGSYTITPDRHRRVVEHTFGADVFETAEGGEAHPIFAHLTTHVGKGWTFDEFLAQVGATPEDGVVFGGGTFDFATPLRIGAPYRVEAWISAASRKFGGRIGVFDAITMTHEATAEGEGAFTVRTTETYIVPRDAALLDAGPGTSTGEAPPPPQVDNDDRDALTHTVGPVRIASIHEIMKVMGDNNPVHIDLDLARRTGYRGRVNQGPANLSYLLAAVARWRGGISGLRTMSFQFRDTVTEDDLLEVVAPRSVLTDLQLSARLDVQGVGTALVATLGFDGA